jgi:precorrin-6A/cobalt-precorrin-6A reductase
VILILGGTTEAFRVAEELLRDGKEFLLSTATEYGLERFRERFGHRVLGIRFTKETLEEFIKEKGIREIIDCTHPYAEVITSLAKEVAKGTGVVYRSEIRGVDYAHEIDYEKAVFVENLSEAARFIKDRGIKRPLFTTGSKDLSFAATLKDLEVFVRVLPYEDSIRRCHDAGIKRANIIAMQGPFSQELNRAIIGQFGIECIVTKQSGREGGFFEKLGAAIDTGIWFIVVKK